MCSSMKARSLSRYSCAAGLRAKSMAGPFGSCGRGGRSGGSRSSGSRSGGKRQSGNALARLCKVAVGGGQTLGPLEVEVRVVLPREADAPVELDHRGSGLLGHLAGFGLGDGGREFDVLAVGVDRERGVE